jgi:endogenous inhibitor of DNA gyrase (YacG/DUF329 family)
MVFSDKRILRKKNIPLKDCKSCGHTIPRITTTDTKRNSASKYALRMFCSNKCRGIALVKKYRGTGNPNYKDGITSILQRLKGSAAYRQWRKIIFERDNYTCQFCSKRGGDIQADHIKPVSVFPEAIFDISNGRTLCVDCHSTTDSWCNPKIRSLYGV